MGQELHAAVRGDTAAKVYRRGTHRGAPPEVTLERVRPLFPKMGVTRLGEITRLDRIGLPVAQAVRPMGRSLSVSQGKGLELAAALASAAMEAAETWHAETAAPNLPRATAEELRRTGRAVSLDGLAASPAVPGELDALPLRWCQATLLGDGGEIAVPFDCVGADFTAPPDSDCFQRSTNGLASGLSAAEATVAALCELIERDCVADFLDIDPPAREARRLPLAALEGSTVAGPLAALRRAGLRLDLWDITNEIGIAAYLARIIEPPAPHRPRPLGPSGGSGCHLDAEVAVVRAVTEAVQSRATRISGARDDIDPADYAAAPDQNRAALLDEIFAGAPATVLRADESQPTFAEDVAVLEARLAAAGLAEVALVDLGRPGAGLAVVRAVVPGLAISLPAHAFVQGLRRRRRAAR